MKTGPSKTWIQLIVLLLVVLIVVGTGVTYRRVIEIRGKWSELKTQAEMTRDEMKVAYDQRADFFSKLGAPQDEIDQIKKMNLKTQQEFISFDTALNRMNAKYAEKILGLEKRKAEGIRDASKDMSAGIVRDLELVERNVEKKRAIYHGLALEANRLSNRWSVRVGQSALPELPLFEAERRLAKLIPTTVE